MADEKLRKIKRIKVNSVDFDVDFTPIGYLTSPNNTDFTVKVTNEGNIFAVDENNVPSSGNTPTASGQTLPKLYINSFYCGGIDADEHTLNYCSHNFVELSNVTNNDINLEGKSLQYAIDGTDWVVLPLKGVIKAGSTFVVRGAVCSMYNSPTTKIKVDKYDQEWIDSRTGEPIKFDSNASAKFYLAFNLNPYTNANPYNPTGKNVAADALGYIDLVGVKGTYTPGGFEGTGEDDGKGPYYLGGGLSNTKIFRKYYSMDPGAKATKKIGARVNANDWCFVDLTKNDGEVIPSIKVYRPMASSEGKTLFYDKTDLYPNKPSMITCSFGRKATDDGVNGATRCFNWITGNLNNKYIWVRESGETSWGEAHESFYGGDEREIYTAECYNRIMKEYTNNTVIIANKFIISGLSAGVYEYIAGSMNEDGTPKIEDCTDVRHFTVRSNTEVSSGFTFCQTTDQQGFNWAEYRIWEAASKCIEKEDALNPRIQFMINTGDMTQDGNRLYEWLDYFNAKGNFFNNMEEMATIGNNDLSHRILYQTLDNDDNDKVWHENITFFYTFELDPNNMPIFVGGDGNSYLIPSLYSFDYGKAHFMCINSEIKTLTETSEFAYGFSKSGNFYPQIKRWCERDIEPYSADTTTSKIAYCHEMPFTLLTSAVTETTGATPTTRSGGSSANDNNPDDNKFWLSEFFQTHGIKLCLGGHKHTEASTWQLVENVTYDNGTRTVDSMHPIIVVNNDPTSDFYIGKYCVAGHEEDTGSTVLVEYNGYKYPNKWFNGSTLKTVYEKPSQLCTFAMESKLDGGIVPVLYAMSQATSYKHTSNKETPGKNLPWLRYYFPQNDGSANANQKFPFYTIWTVNNTEITGEVRKVLGAFDGKGKFDININYPDVKKGISAIDHTSPIQSINGITDMDVAHAKEDTRIITVKK